MLLDQEGGRCTLAPLDSVVTFGQFLFYFSHTTNTEFIYRPFVDSVCSTHDDKTIYSILMLQTSVPIWTTYIFRVAHSISNAE